MNINDVAQASGLSTRLIRYYERIGLVGPIMRSLPDNRVYSRRDTQILIFIARLRAAGYSRSEISELLSLWRDRTREPYELRAAAARQAQVLTAKVTALCEVIEVLSELAESRHGENMSHYPEIKKPSHEIHTTSHDAGLLRYIGRGH